MVASGRRQTPSVHSAKSLMWKAAFILLLLASILATPHNNRGRKNRNRKKVHLPDCPSGILTMDSGTLQPVCYHERNAVYSRATEPIFNCSDVRSLTLFNINHVQYLAITDKKQGLVNVTKWESDRETYVTVQTLEVTNAYSSEVIYVGDGDILLVVAVFDGGHCQQCGALTSPVFQWKHAAMRFGRRSIQELPATRFIHWFRERYQNRTTSIVAIGRCRCHTATYYWDPDREQFRRTDGVMSDDGEGDVLITSVRFHQTRLVISASLDRDNTNTPLRVHEYHNGAMVYQGNLPTNVQDRRGLSAVAYKNNAFICTVTKAGALMAQESQAQVFKLRKDRSGYSLQEMISVTDQVSLCKFFVHSQSHDLYAAVGFWNGTKLLRYCPVTETFRMVEGLGLDYFPNDLVNFKSGDDDFMITAQWQRACTIYKNVGFQ